MQLTIDSTEPLDRVLDVIGTLYGVRLAAEQADTADETASTSTDSPSRAQSPRRRTTGKAAVSRRGTTRSPRSPQKLDQQAVRAWARENGHPVRDRGRLPATLLAAYQAAAG